MLAAREAHYGNAEKMRETGSVYVGQALEGFAARSTAVEMPPWKVAASLRSFLLGSFVGDETWSVSIISRMRPRQLDLDPGTLMYGGAYIYSLCFMLGTAAAAGSLPLSGGVGFFLQHPEKTAAVFIICRALSALSLMAAAILLFFTVKKRLAAPAGAAAALFLLLSPTVLYNAHLAKPHLFAMFWSLLAFHFAARLSDSDDRRNYLLAGAASGLALGALLPNGLIFAAVLFAEYLKKRSLRSIVNKNTVSSLACMAGVFLLTNPYVFKGLLTTVAAANTTYSYGVLRPAAIPAMLETFFSGAVSWTFLPLFLFGTAAALRSPVPFWRLTVLTAWLFILTNVLFLRHTGLFCSAVPFIAALCAFALAGLFARGAAGKLAGAFFLAAALTVGGWDALTTVSAFTETPNMQAAGEWINGNVPAGSSIGLVRSEDLRPAMSPYMRFLDYRIFMIYPDIPPAKNVFLPEYIVLSDFSQRYLPAFGEWFGQRYELEREFGERPSALTRLARDRGDVSPRTVVYLYRLKKA